MNITTYFIKHPVTATVLNAMIVLVGILCFYSLSLREYPEIILPTLTVNATYPNASSDLVETAITNVLEDQLTAVEGIENITSSSMNNTCSIVIKFRSNISVDRALMNVKDAISRARSELPTEVREPTIERGEGPSGPPFMAICLESSSMGFGELTHYANIVLKNSFRSIKGVALVDVYGQPYSYKVTLDHQKLYSFGINADEVYSAIAKSNVSLPVGMFQKELPVTLNSELKTVEDFENILVKAIPNPVFLKSLATIELAVDDQERRLKVNGKPGLCIGVTKTSDDNPLEVSALVHQQFNELLKTLPSTIKMYISLDQAEFIRASLQNIKSSIIEAILFVLVVVFLFLRNLRATLIPIITIPISLIGSLIFLKLCGFSINIMTLLAMVLAVGLVVDDAIVVLENITRHIENGSSSLNASISGAKEIGFAVVAMTLTLTSVYAPIAFVSGIVGSLFIEFAAALAGSVLISGIVAITLSPLMCAKLLKAETHNNILPSIDIFLAKLADGYISILRVIMSYKKCIIVFLIFSITVTIVGFSMLPHETAPAEDRGLIGVFIPAIPGKDLDNLEANVEKVENIIKNIPEAMGSITFMGDWGGQVILPLKSRKDRKRSTDEIINSLRPQMLSFPSLDAWVWNWSTSLPGLDNPSQSSELTLVISTIDPYKKLLTEINIARKKGEEQKLFSSIYHDLKLDNLGLDIDVDKNILGKLNLTEGQVAKTIEIFFSGDRSLEFRKDGILYPIKLEGDIKPWSLDELYLTNAKGNRVSISNFSKLSTKEAPNALSHYNQMRSVNFKVNLTSRENLEEAMNKLYKLADETLPKSYKKSWIGIAKTYAESATSMQMLFFLSILFIYAILAIQFESFIDPFIVLLTVPLGCFGAMVVLYLTGGTLNIYSQVGLITLIGLITKHGILIVEFANQLRRQGSSLLEAIEQSVKLRLRPILMTTLAMLCGSIPLVLSTTAGCEARHAIGVVLLAGLGFGSVFTLFVLPSLYCLVKSIIKE
jgi:multidrug efflux pump